MALVLVAAALAVVARAAEAAGPYRAVGWNNLGMHCMDADFSVFSILPPYNVLVVQVIDGTGTLVTDPAGLTVTYQAVADPSGSINRTSQGKTNFWQFAMALFGANLAVDQGLAGFGMPGTANTPQPMRFDPAHDWFIADGIPVTPYDDAGRKNPYPMVRVTVSDAAAGGTATTDVVLPVSDEMDCRACHLSGSGTAAEPAAGWVNLADEQRDYRLNVLRLHDDRQGGSSGYAAALQQAGYLPTGLYATASAGTPVLCARCHGSNALPGTGLPGIPALTTAMHGRHAGVTDPTNGLTLDSSVNRSACYRCHPGSETRCLRGAMGAAVAANGQLAIQCQGCHGSMSQVGLASRQGWLDEPSCQQCHTGTAVHNNGQIRFTSAFESNGQPRIAVDATFATAPDTPLPGTSLFRFSTGHGGLQCEACHGSTHAEYPSSHGNDNVQAIAFQGHAGTLSECSSCHGGSPATRDGGPHGMHPVGQSWVESHGDAAEGAGTASCANCHGADYRGTVLSRSFADRNLTTKFGAKTFWRGFQVGCYACHDGPKSESASPNHPPVVKDLTAQTTSGVPVAIALAATDADGNALALRVVSHAAHGTVGLIGSTATYYPDPSYTGADAFTYAAWDGSTDSNLGHVAIQVGAAAPCALSCSASVATTAKVGVAVGFSASADTGTCGGTAQFDWDYGDGSPHGTGATSTHTYAAAGSFAWTLNVTANGLSCARTGGIAVAPACSAPSINAQPQDASVSRGGRATLSVTASGTSPLGFQWYLGVSGDTSKPISGATKASYTTPRLYQTTTYWVNVTNGCGSIGSRTVTVSMAGRAPRRKG